MGLGPVRREVAKRWTVHPTRPRPYPHTHTQRQTLLTYTCMCAKPPQPQPPHLASCRPPAICKYNSPLGVVARSPCSGPLASETPVHSWRQAKAPPGAALQGCSAGRRLILRLAAAPHLALPARGFTLPCSTSEGGCPAPSHLARSRSSRPSFPALEREREPERGREDCIFLPQQ